MKINEIKLLLKEETGYNAKVLFSRPFIAKNPEVTDELNALDFCEVNKKDVNPQNLQNKIGEYFL